MANNPGTAKAEQADRDEKLDLPEVDGYERGRHDAALRHLRTLHSLPPQGRVDLCAWPTSSATRARIERLWAECFDVQPTKRTKLRTILGSGDEYASPAALLYATFYHFPTVPPWEEPHPPAHMYIERLRERFTLTELKNN
jgi:hypothetical protein